MLSISLSLDKLDERRKIRSKGNSLTIIPSEYVVLDIETTGLSAEYDDIIEVALLKIKDGKEIDRFQSLIQPPESEYYIDEDDDILVKQNIKTDENGDKYVTFFVDDFITDLTGITNEMLKDAPIFEEIADKIYDFIGENIIVGYNVHFDLNFLIDNFEKALNKSLKNDFVDLLRLSRKIFPDLENHKLTTLAQTFCLSTDNNHRALSDCVITNNLLNKINNVIADKNIDLNELFKKHHIDLTQIEGDKNQLDPSHPLYGKNCVFTGKLELLQRTEAAHLVASIGGLPQNGVNKHTNFLIIGNLDYSKNIKEGKSSKQKKAEQLILSGADLSIITEADFYDLVFEK